MSDVMSYRELDVWKQARVLVKGIYDLTKKFPKEEQFGLTSQIRRAAISVPSNIAEGCGRNHSKDSIQFFFIARGSIYELETQLILSEDLEFATKEDIEQNINQAIRCKKLINGFINYYQKQSNNQQRTTVNENLEEYGNNN